jgi:co-chaperonin GroES (HSP10)/GNAT superfamily N-acetyltransferase
MGGRLAGQLTPSEELTKTGVAMPDAPRAVPAELRLVAVGPGRERDNASAESVDVQPGLKVVYAKFAGSEFAMDGEDLPVISHRDILSVVAGGARQAGRTLPPVWAATRRRDRRAQGPTPTIRRLGPGDDGLVLEAAALFEHAPEGGATERFLRSGDHHLLVAHLGNEPAGFVTGVELTYPDKGTEMFLYELGVAEPFRRRGIGTALVSALKDLAVDLGCIDMWVLTDSRNECGMATYRAAGGTTSEPTEMLTWDLRQSSAALS